MHQGSNGRNGRACTGPISDISDPQEHEHGGVCAVMRMFLGLLSGALNEDEPWRSPNLVRARQIHLAKQSLWRMLRLVKFAKAKWSNP